MRNYADHLSGAYPGAAIAVMFIELIYCSTDEEHPVSALDMIRQKRPNMNPREVAEMIAASVHDLDLSSMGDKAELIFEQLWHGDFLRFVAGKMGAM